MTETTAPYTANYADTPGFLDPESLLSTLESPLTGGATEPDGDLEVLSLIGRGDTGTVHRVKDKRTGTIFARKTIETRVEPMKNLLRLLSAVSAAPHETTTIPASLKHIAFRWSDGSN